VPLEKGLSALEIALSALAKALSTNALVLSALPYSVVSSNLSVSQRTGKDSLSFFSENARCILGTLSVALL
jgi:hypothetical protein